MKSLLAIAATLALAAPLRAQTVSVDFNGGDATNWTSQFVGSSAGSVLGTNWNWSGSAGVQSTPLGALTSITNPSLTYNSAFIGTNDILNISASFYNSTAGTPASGSGYLQLGFAASTNNTLTGNSVNDLFALRLEGVGVANTLSWKVRVDASSTTASNAPISNLTGGSNMVFSLSNWYRLSATFTKSTNAGNWDFSAQMNNIGADGTNTPSLLGGFGGTFSMPGIYSASNLFGIMSFRNDSGAVIKFNQLDNLDISVVPEPATCALLAAGFSTLLVTRFCRRR